MGFAPNPAVCQAWCKHYPKTLGSVLGLIWPPESFESSAVRRWGTWLWGACWGRSSLGTEKQTSVTLSCNPAADNHDVTPADFRGDFASGRMAKIRHGV